MILKEFVYHRPRTLGEADKLLKALESAKILAGGTFLLTRLRGGAHYKNIISLKDILCLSAIKKTKEAIIIGAMATLDDIMRNSEIKKHLPLLSESIAEVATPQIRNMATIGGNICSRLPWADLPYILLALNAKQNFSKQKILREIIIPLSPITKYAFLRMPKTNNTDIPLCSVCIVKIDKGVAVAANLGNNLPRRFPKTEKDLNIDTFARELSEVQKDEYLRQMLVVCFKRALERYGK